MCVTHEHESSSPGTSGQQHLQLGRFESIILSHSITVVRVVVAYFTEALVDGFSGIAGIVVKIITGVDRLK